MARTKPATKKASKRTPSNPKPKTASKAKQKAKATAKTTTPEAARPQVLGATVRDDSWMTRIRRNVVLKPGATTNSLLRVPVGDATQVIRSTVRLVADLPVGASSDVVWATGSSELTVHTAGLTFACDPGLVTIGVPVSCDQVPKAVVTVSLAVGTEAAPTGLLMSTFAVPQGPAAIVDVWAGAITAFAWEALLHLAQQLSAEVGVDASKQPLVPALVGAASGVLLVQPMARHDVFRGAS
jgi:hypothetical protein